MSEITTQSHSEEVQTETEVSEMSIVDHLEELRRRLIICIIAIAVGSTAAYFYAQELVHFITLPAGKLYYLNPAEAFFTYLKVSFFAGFLLVLPIVLYQVWAFVVPALTKQERNMGIVLIPSSVLLFFCRTSVFIFLRASSRYKVFYGVCNRRPSTNVFPWAIFVFCNFIFNSVWFYF